jgi:glycosyltransferase involved in cell wall biosynthesis
MKHSLSVVIPFYNEEENVAHVVNEVSQTLNTAAIPHEFVCVNNGSHDNTGAILKSLREENFHITIITIPHNEGYGWGVSRGMKAATKDWITVISGDGQVNPEDIVRAHTTMEQTGADIITPRRRVREDGWYRRFISFVYNLIMKILFALPGWDYNAPPKIFTRSFIQSISIESKNSFIDPEILIKAKKKHAHIEEIFSTYRLREHGSGYTSVYTILEFIRDIIFWRFGRRV